MSRMNRRFRRPARGAPPTFHWHRERAFVASVGTNTNSTQILLGTADYADNVAMSPSGVTLVRTIIEVAWNPAATTQGPYVVQFGVSVSDADAAPFSVGITQDLTDERWLGLGMAYSRLYGTGIAAGAATLASDKWHLDTKQKVKLRDSVVHLHVFNDSVSAGSIAYGFVVSLLLRGDTN